MISADQLPSNLNTVNLPSSRSEANHFSKLSMQKIPGIGETDMQSIIEDESSDDDITNKSVYELEKKARTKSLAILIQRRESIRHMQTLRKVHASKLKEQKKLLTDIADTLTSNRVNFLREMYAREMGYFYDQYDGLIELNYRLVNNEHALSKVNTYFYRIDPDRARKRVGAEENHCRFDIRVQ